MNKKIVIISVIVLFIDQVIKAIVETLDVSVTVIENFLSFNFYQNTGAAWSILEGRVPLLIFITIIMLVLVYSMSFSYDEGKLSDVSFGLLFGGILGNLVDRIFCGYVRDFIDMNLFGYDFPVFNIADMTIVIGVVILLVSTIKGEIKSGDKGSRRGKLRKN